MKFENFPERQREILSKHLTAPTSINGETGHLVNAAEIEPEETTKQQPDELPKKLARKFISFIERSRPPETD